jgi:hypothetical protein
MPSEPSASDLMTGLDRAEPGSLALLRGWCREPIARLVNRPRPIGTVGVDSPSAREKDLVRVSARLERPADCYVIAFNPGGHDQLYYPPDRDVPPPKSAEIDVPVAEGYFSLTDGAGLQAFGLAASNKPLPPYERWRAGLGEVPWQPTQADGVWRSDGRGLELAMAAPSGTAAPSEPLRTLSQLKDSSRLAPA